MMRSVESLLNLSVKIVYRVKQYRDSIKTLPCSAKDELIKIMSFDGTITDSNIGQVLHAGTRVLNLRNCRVSDSALKEVHCPQLRTIIFRECSQITSEGLEALASRCPCLQVVYLPGCTAVTDSGVLALARNCKGLAVISLERTGISDVSLIEIGANCRFLDCINFGGTEVTDKGVISLVSGVGSKSLKELQMIRCRNLTDEAVAAILSNCVNIRIFDFHGCPLITVRSWDALDDHFGPDKIKQISWSVY